MTDVNRDELIEAGARALATYTGTGLQYAMDTWSEESAAVLAAVLPMVTEAIAEAIESRVTPMPMPVPHSVIVAYAAEIARDWEPTS